MDESVSLRERKTPDERLENERAENECPTETASEPDIPALKR